MARRRGGQRRGIVRSERPPVRVLPMLGLSLLLLVGGWSALWLFARHEAAKQFSLWQAGERSFGRSWTCPDQHIGGYPLGIVLTCDHPTFQGPVGDGLYKGSLAGLKAEAQLYFPTNVTVTLGGPLQAAEVDGDRRVDANWSGATVTLRGLLPANLDRGQLEMSDLVVGPAPAAGQVSHLTLGFKPVSRAPNTRADLDLTLAAEGAKVPALDPVLGSADPLQVRFAGFATQVDLSGSRMTLPDLLDPWVSAGGQLHVENLDVSAGAFQAHAAGRMGLDEEHRLQGRLDTGFSGLDPVAKRLGLPLGVVQVGGLLSGLLGGGAARTDQPAADVTLPLVAKDGRLRLGPIDTGVKLLPLY